MLHNNLCLKDITKHYMLELLIVVIIGWSVNNIVVSCAYLVSLV